IQLVGRSSSLLHTFFSGQEKVWKALQFDFFWGRDMKSSFSLMIFAGAVFAVSPVADASGIRIATGSASNSCNGSGQCAANQKLHGYYW
ncbi:MAG: hypothetical protein K8F25_12015, partial [Fimbriimonadaceae bacterium]|nr:hypothetical protein [Alphaproteobacteria bacterium]